MKSIRSIGLLALATGLLSAGTLDIGHNPGATIAFESGVITLGDCSGGPCIFSGANTIGPVTLNWNFSTPAAAGVTYSGLNSPFAVSQSLATAFSLTDTETIPDTIVGNLIFDSATVGGAVTDLHGILTITNASVTNADAQSLLLGSLGLIPGVGGTLNLDLLVDCDDNCIIPVGDPDGFVSAVNLSPGAVGPPPTGAPEPGTFALLGSGFAAIGYRLRRRLR